MPKKRRPPEPCVLCGSVDEPTKEDVFPTWARTVLVGELRARGLDETRLPRRVTMPMCRPHNQACSVFERVAAPLVMPLLTGRPITLTRRDQARVAAWVYLKDVEYQLIRNEVWGPDGPMPRNAVELERQRTLLRVALQDRRPPLEYSIRVGGWSPAVTRPKVSAAFVPEWLQGLRDPTRTSAVWPIGKMVTEGVHTANTGWLRRFERETAGDERLLRIWPPRPHTVQIPARTLSYAEIVQLRLEWGHHPDNNVGTSLVAIG